MLILQERFNTLKMETGMRRSSAEEEIDEVDDSQSVSTLDREANFLLGRVSTFGRAVRFNSRLMFS